MDSWSSKPQRTLTPVTPPKTSRLKMDRPGPVGSPNPYYTIKMGENEVYRDAKDPRWPTIGPSSTSGSHRHPPGQAVGPLAASLDAFRSAYYKFESGGNPKWADLQVVVALDGRRRDPGRLRPSGRASPASLPALPARRLDGDPDDPSLSVACRHVLGVRPVGAEPPSGSDVDEHPADAAGSADRWGQQRAEQV